LSGKGQHKFSGPIQGIEKEGRENRPGGSWKKDLLTKKNRDKSEYRELLPTPDPRTTASQKK